MLERILEEMFGKKLGKILENIYKIMLKRLAEERFKRILEDILGKKKIITLLRVIPTMTFQNSHV